MCTWTIYRAKVHKDRMNANDAIEIRQITGKLDRRVNFSKHFKSRNAQPIVTIRVMYDLPNTNHSVWIIAILDLKMG